MTKALTPRRLGAWAFGVLIALWTLGPLYWAFVVSTSKNSAITAVPPPVFPHPFTFAAFESLLNPHNSTGSQFLMALRNSSVEALLVTAIAMAAALPAAYAFTRLRFRGRRLFFLVVIGSLSVPVYVILVPVYKLVADLNQINTYQAISFILAAGQLPLATWLLTGHISGLPAEIEEAARCDGARTRTILRRIILPLIAPGAAGTAALVFLAAWGAFLVPLVFAATLQVQPLSVVIPQYTTKYTTDYSLQAAAGLLALLPPILLALWLNRHLVQGILRGAVK